MALLSYRRCSVVVDLGGGQDQCFRDGAARHLDVMMPRLIVRLGATSCPTLQRPFHTRELLLVGFEPDCSTACAKWLPLRRVRSGSSRSAPGTSASPPCTPAYREQYEHFPPAGRIRGWDQVIALQSKPKHNHATDPRTQKIVCVLGHDGSSRRAAFADDATPHLVNRCTSSRRSC